MRWPCRSTRRTSATPHASIKNAITAEVVALQERGAKFKNIRHLVSGSRGKLASQNDQVDQGVI
jgi:hypothetical protein